MQQRLADQQLKTYLLIFPRLIPPSPRARSKTRFSKCESVPSHPQSPVDTWIAGRKGLIAINVLLVRAIHAHILDGAPPFALRPSHPWDREHPVHVAPSNHS